MLKKILLLFLSFPLIFSFASCKNSSSNINHKKVSELKDLLAKQDLFDFTKKSIGTMYTQKYDVLDVYNDEDVEESNSSYFNYISLGFLDSYYEITDEQFDEIKDENGNINTFDAISIGKGGYRITQSAKTSSFSRDNGESSIIKSLDISQQMTLKVTEDDVIVYNILDVTDNQVFDYASRQNFNGTINKELLFDSVSTRSFREIFSQVNLFDTPGNIEYIDKLYYSICKDLKNKNDKEINKFINDNQISIEEVENKIELNFVYEERNIDDIYLDNIFPGTIKGSLFYDKETGSFDEFNYEIKYVQEVYDEQSGSLKTANMIFTCSGKSARNPQGDMWTPDNPTIYDDVVNFLENVTNEVIPPSL